MKRRKPLWRTPFSLLHAAILFIASSIAHSKLVCSPLSRTCCSTPYSFVSYDYDPPAFPPACAQQKLSSLFSLEPLDFLKQHALILPSASKRNALFTANASLALAQLSYASLTDSRPSLLLRHRLRWQRRSGTAYTVKIKKNPATSDAPSASSTSARSRTSSSVFATPFYFSSKSELKNAPQPLTARLKDVVQEADTSARGGSGLTAKSGLIASQHSGSRSSSKQTLLNTVTISNASIPTWTVGVQSLDWAAIQGEERERERKMREIRMENSDVGTQADWRQVGRPVDRQAVYVQTVRAVLVR